MRERDDIVRLHELSRDDVALVGGNNLAEMTRAGMLLEASLRRSREAP